MASATQLDGVAQLQYSKHDSEAGRRVEALTEQAIRRLQQRFEDNKEAALEGIVAQVLSVCPTLHRNLVSTH
ncbi:unnamed protein product [Hydatigera taeniaeformis]|uniref:Dynamin_M domain-containing protein n=1 Tax=Hydatigena taeniaeformis TaxID=6205 RepID=A0A0R3WIT3_HYDTA|nr:unnamed protein product [Hydatigera taeniaeformis]